MSAWLRCGKAFLLAAGFYLVLPTSFAASRFFTISNPSWLINLTEFGYADIAADVDGGGNRPLYFREYLSGEWGAAISHSGAPEGEWFEREFVFPDWSTNSTFVVTSPFSFRDSDSNGVPDVNGDGFNIFTSTIRNARFSVTQTYEFLDTVTGMAQGVWPASGEGSGSSVTSDRYVLKQTYRVTNISEAPILGVQLFQFLHGLHSTTAVFDDDSYEEGSICGGVSCRDYRYDVTMRGPVRAFVDLDRPFQDEEGQPRRATDVTDLFGFVPAIDDAFLRSLLGKDEAGIDAAFREIRVILDPNTISGIARSEFYVINDDIIAFHSNDAPIGAEDVNNPPFGWAVGRYGVRGADSHEIGKPSTGVHLSVESGVLNGPDSFDPGNKWVSGAQVFALGDLNPGESVTFDVLLSVSTTQTQVEKPNANHLSAPAGLPFLGSALARLARR